MPIINPSIQSIKSVSNPSTKHIGGVALGLDVKVGAAVDGEALGLDVKVGAAVDGEEVGLLDFAILGAWDGLAEGEAVGWLFKEIRVNGERAREVSCDWFNVCDVEREGNGKKSKI